MADSEVSTLPAPTPPLARERVREAPKIWWRWLWAAQEWFNRRVPWHRLWPILGVANLILIRGKLRALNLFDANDVDRRPRSRAASDAIGRSADGQHMCPFAMTGAAFTRFGRNFDFDHCAVDEPVAAQKPNPREVSRSLLARREFQPAAGLNLLLAAWLQFVVHDWLRHGFDEGENATPLELELGANDTWPEKPMRVPPTPRDSMIRRAPTFLNRETHWWDGSQIYGSRADIANTLRTHHDGKLRIDENNRLPLNPSTARHQGPELSGSTDNWWLGLSVLHRLFALEHNAICDQLHRDHPDLSDEELFQKARLVNCALIAKIHMLEWTPVLLDHPTMHKGMRVAWWGFFGKRVHQLLRDTPWLNWIKLEILRGIPGSRVNDHGVPYSLSEEFVAVYRMHSLLPDSIALYSFGDRKVRDADVELPQITFANTRRWVEARPMEDLLYSLGMQAPGQLCLHNFPKHLRDFQDGKHPLTPPVDLAAVDILRDRERGIPRYNKFRELLHLPRLKDFSEFDVDAATQNELRELYGDVNKVDLMVGLHAEKRPPGFVISETAFRIFLLMASRRLQADPWFTTHYNAQTYTAAGLRWIDDNSFASVLRRHHPALQAVVGENQNPFKNWARQ
jgi:hypothetical protein